MGWENPDPFVMVVVPGFLGGLFIALCLGLLQRHSHRRNVAVSAAGREPLSTDVINMAHIRVAGVGGLGLVAMAAVVAWNVPRIGQPIALAGVLGVACGVLLVLWRRRQGPLPSSGAHAGATTTLAIDDIPERKSN